MNNCLASPYGGSSRPGRVVPGYRPAVLQALLLVLAVAFAVGCSDGEANIQTPVVAPTLPAATAAVEAQTPTANPPKSDAPTPVADRLLEVAFPQHDAPLGTDDGGSYWAGQLVLHDGCLGVEVPPDVNGPGGTSLLVWPSGFVLSVEDRTVRIVDAAGRVAANVGDHIRLTSATISYTEALNRGLIGGMSGDCEGPYFMVGDEVTAFDPNNESTELRLTDPDVFFPRQKTIIATSRTQKVAEGGGELVLDGQCLRVVAGDESGHPIIWPAGFEPHVEQGVIQVRNGAGRVIAKVGDRIIGGGGYSSSGYADCPGETFEIHSIKVLPDVEVYFPKQYGTLATDQEMERFVGKLVVERRCLKVDEAVRVRDRVIVPGDRHLLIWPEDFTLSLEGEAAGVVDASGRVAARVGDEIEFSAVSISYQEAMDHTGYRELSPACGGGYWVVGEDFAGVGDGESQ